MLQYTGTPSRKYIPGHGFFFFDSHTEQNVLELAKRTGLPCIEEKVLEFIGYKLEDEIILKLENEEENEQREESSTARTEQPD